MKISKITQVFLKIIKKKTYRMHIKKKQSLIVNDINIE